MIGNAVDRFGSRFRTFALAGVIGIVIGACSSAAPAPLVGPTPRPIVTEAPLATEAVPSTAPDTEEPTAAPTAEPDPTAATAAPTASYFKPPGWDGSSDVDCPDFDTRAHAQSFFKGTGGSKTNDPYRLDSNHDGVACESLP